MKNTINRQLSVLGLLVSLCCLPAWAQNYSIDWYKIAGEGVFWRLWS